MSVFIGLWLSVVIIAGHRPVLRPHGAFLLPGGGVDCPSAGEGVHPSARSERVWEYLWPRSEAPGHCWPPQTLPLVHLSPWCEEGLNEKMVFSDLAHVSWQMTPAERLHYFPLFILTQHFQVEVAARLTGSVVSHTGVASCVIDLGLDDL